MCIRDSSGIDNGAALAEVSAAGLGTATLDAMNEAMAGTAEGTQPILDGLSMSFDGTMTDMNLTADTQMTQLDTAVQAGFSGIVTDAGKFGNDFKDEIERTDLYQSGINIMRGLNNGLKSMRSTVISTARGIGTDLKGAVNGSLDIHSPSRVMEMCIRDRDKAINCPAVTPGTWDGEIINTCGPAICNSWNVGQR